LNRQALIREIGDLRSAIGAMRVGAARFEKAWQTFLVGAVRQEVAQFVVVFALKQRFLIKKRSKQHKTTLFLRKIKENQK
jgi:hypothetical protein